VLFGCGDILAQQAVDRKGFDKHDMARTGRMALYGGGEFLYSECEHPSSSNPSHESLLLTECLAIFGPAATTWFAFLQRNVVLKSHKATIVARVIADQGLFTPTHLTCFLTSMAIMEGTDPIEKWRTSFLPSYKANLTIWPLVQGVNFSIVPLEYRVLVVNVVSLGELRPAQTSRFHSANMSGSGWNCILSLINSGEK
jgi:protein Mpv17